MKNIIAWTLISFGACVGWKAGTWVWENLAEKRLEKFKKDFKNEFEEEGA